MDKKGTSWAGTSHTVLKEEYVYDPWLDISLYPTLIQLKYYLDRIHHCVTVFGKCIFTVFFLLYFLSQKTIWTTVELLITKQK